MAMTIEDAQKRGDALWGSTAKHKVYGRAWHMFARDPEKEYFKLEWPDGFIRGRGKTLEAAFEDSGHPVAQGENRA